jgi:hypothetical protein
VSLRERVLELVTAGEDEALNELVADEPRAIRYLVGCTYHADADMRGTACRAVGRAARHHPELVQQVVRRLVWAMNDESGTNALTAPAVVRAVAAARPDLLLPLVPDLTRLAADEGLREALAETLLYLKEKFPGSVGRGIEDSLNKEFRKLAKRRKRSHDRGS